MSHTLGIGGREEAKRNPSRRIRRRVEWGMRTRIKTVGGGFSITLVYCSLYLVLRGRTGWRRWWSSIAGSMDYIEVGVVIRGIF